MGKVIMKGVPFGGSAGSAEHVKYDETSNVKEVIEDVKDDLSKVLYVDSFDSSTGTLTTRSADYTG